MTPNDLPTGGYARDAVEIEGYLRGFARRRPDVSVTVLRFASLVGPRIDTVRHPLLRAAGRAHRPRLRRPRCSCCTRRTRSPCWNARSAHDAARHVQRRRRRRAAALAGHPPGGAGAAAGAARPRSGRSAGSLAARPAASTSRPSRCACSTSAGSWTPPACAPRSASPRAGPPCRPSTTSCAAARCHPVIGPERVEAAERAGRPRGARGRPAARRAREARHDRRRPGRPRTPDRRRDGPRHPAARRPGRARRPRRPRPRRRPHAAPSRAERPAGRRPTTGRPGRRRFPRPPTDRARRRRRPAAEPGLPPDWEAALADALRVPAPAADRRLRGRRVRLRRRPDRQRHPPAAAAAVPDVVPGRDHRPAQRARTRAARWSSPTTPAPSRSTR